jgi:hypothetical protein
MIIDDLKKVMLIPEIIYNFGSKDEWEKIENNIRMELPSDYKLFVSSYGSGVIDNFLWILNPFIKNENLNLLKKINIIINAYKESKKKFPKEFLHEVYPKKGGLFPWAITDNGDEIYWKMDGNPDKWSIIIYATRSFNFIEFKMSMIEFLCNLLTNKIKCNIFPEDFPGNYNKYKAEK